jgi:ABC-type bacteriocin/lantibiotic exporter with double-glycine peptidase domain
MYIVVVLFAVFIVIMYLISTLVFLFFLNFCPLLACNFLAVVKHFNKWSELNYYFLQRQSRQNNNFLC